MLAPQPVAQEPLEQRFFAGILPLVQSAFQARNRITRAKDVYAMYGRTAGNPQAATQQGVTDWLGQMTRLAGETGTTVKVQSARKPWVRLERIPADGSGHDLAWLWRTFYHFHNPSWAGDPTGKRVYMHAALPVEQHGITIMRNLLLGLCRNTPGFKEAKIAGPGATARADTIVAYFANANALQQALDLIKAMPGSLFQDGVPRGVLPLPWIHPGVGGADQPVEVEIDGAALDTESYGMALSDLVFRALTNTLQRNPNIPEDELYAMYLWRLQTLMERAGFDPKLPYLMQADYNKV